MNDNIELNDLTKSLGFVLINTAMSIKDEIRKGFMKAGYDVTADQFAVLIRLWNEDGLSQRDLCEQCLKSKSNLTRILDSMEKKELICRRINKEDRRSFSINLTEKSHKMRKNLFLLASNMHEEIFNTVSKEDQEKMLKILEIILLNMG